MSTKASNKRKIQVKDKTVKKAKVESESDSAAESSSDIDMESSDNELESEDDLDNSDGEEEEAQDEQEQQKQEEGEDKGAGRVEQKKLREERKLARPMGVQIQQIKQLWERLRVKKDTPGPVRQKLVNEAWELMKDNVKDLVFKHDAGRVVQSVFKYCDKDKRIKITEALKGSYVELAKSPYGKFLLVKIMHYGNQKTRAQVIDELHGNFAKLMRHKEGAYVIEDIYRQYSTAAQKKQIMREFYGSEYALFKSQDKERTLAEILQDSPDKRPFLMRNLNRIIKSAIEKGSIGFNLIHAAMLEYITNIDVDGQEREDFIDLIHEQFPEIVHTPEGSMVAARALAIATAKERKLLVRSLKPFVTKCAEDEYGFIVLIALFMCIDDTVLVNKSFTPDLKANMTSLIKSKLGRRALLYLLVGKTPRYFPKPVQDKLDIVEELKVKTSKKDDETRRLELNKAFAPIMMESIQKNAQELMTDNLGSQFIAEALLFAHDTDRSEAVKAVLATLQGDKEDLTSESHPLSHPFTARALRTLIQNGTWNSKLGKIEASPEPDLKIAEQLVPIVTPHIVEWATGDGSFAIVALLESDQKSVIKKELKPHVKKLDSENKGSKLILELVK